MHARAPPTRASQREGWGLETRLTLCMSNEHAEYLKSQMRICMTINKHAACALCSGEVPVTLYSVSIQAERNAVDES